MTLSSVKQAGDVCRERLRLDIEWVAYDQGTRWVARDPLSGAFYYFGELEKAAAKLVHGRCVEFPAGTARPGRRAHSALDV